MFEFWYDQVKPKYREKIKSMLNGHKQLFSLYKSGIY